MLMAAGAVAVASVAGVAIAASTAPNGVPVVSLVSTARVIDAAQSPDGSLVVMAVPRGGDPTDDGTGVLSRATVLKAGKWRARSLSIPGAGSRVVEDITATGEGVFAGVRPRITRSMWRVRGTQEVPGPRKLPVLPGEGDSAHWGFPVYDRWLLDRDSRNRMWATAADGRLRRMPSGDEAASPSGDEFASGLDLDGVLRDWSAIGKVRTWPFPKRAGIEAPWNDRTPDGVQIGWGEDAFGYAVFPGDRGGFVSSVDALRQDSVRVIAADGSGYTTRPSGFEGALARVAFDRSSLQVHQLPVGEEMAPSCAPATKNPADALPSIGSIWNGPGGDLWAMIGCGELTDYDAIQTQPEPHFKYWWLARWKAGSATPSIVRLPDPPNGWRKFLKAKGKAMRDGSMHVLTRSGTFRITGLERPFGAASIVSVRRPKGNVRVRVRCIGEPGQACFGTITIRDGKGTLGRMSYGAEAGTAPQRPIVTRELRPRRAIQGKVTATLGR